MTMPLFNIASSPAIVTVEPVALVSIPSPPENVSMTAAVAVLIHAFNNIVVKRDMSN